MGKTRQIAAWMAAVLLSTTAWAGQQKPPTGAELAKKIDEIFKEWDRSDKPGGVVAIVQGGEMVFSKGYGLANVELGVANTDHTVFDIGSISKQFTATCIMLLAEQGKLDVQDPVSKYIPGIPAVEDNDITIHQLMTHTSGLRDYLSLVGIAGYEMFDDDDVMRVLNGQRTLNFEPGKNWDYSNTGYFLMKEIVEFISGQTLAEFAEENLFDPLGMEHTQFLDDARGIIPGRAFGYIVKPDGELANGWAHIAADGAGGLWTTVQDMMRWTENWKSNKLGASDDGLFKTMRSSHHEIQPDVMSYGYGFFQDKLDGVERIQHGGDFIGFHAMVTTYPKQDLAVYTFGNDGTQLAKSLNDDVARLMLGDAIEKDEEEATDDVELSEEELKDYVGKFQLMTLQIEFKIVDGNLTMNPTGQPQLIMYASEKDHFYLKVADIKVDYTRGEDGKISKIELTQNGQTFELKEAAPYEPTDEELDAVAGRYYSFELNVIITLRKTEDGLEFYTEHDPDAAEVTFVSNRQIKAGIVTMTFTRKDDEIDGLRMNIPRARNMVFQRMIS